MRGQKMADEERLNEKLGDACTGGGFGRTDSRDDCNHALIQDLVQSGASISKSKALPFTLRRKQFPVALAYGLTANKV